MSTTNNIKPLLAITMGDPGGIGPEIAVKSLNLIETYQTCRPLIIGDAGIIQNAIEFCLLDLDVNPVSNPENGMFKFETVDVLDLKNLPLSKLKHKQVTAEQGKASFEYVDKAIQLALQGLVDGTVTGPINKAAINAAGYHFAGHTEIYGFKTGSKDYAMMLADKDFRVVHVSTHVSLRKACDAVREERVYKVIELTHKAVRLLCGREPRIAVCGLNPHCGEDGLFGDEDAKEIVPAINKAKQEGILADGPIPADTVFSKMKGGQYDAVIVMYHDQGHIPMKLMGFQYDEKTKQWGSLSGVNVTLGLPIIRTSVDHGTAFGKAGEGRANPQSLIEAINMAALLASK